MNIYDFELEDNQGKTFALGDLRGKVILVVNTATRCGFTPQYKALEDLYQQDKGKGLEIVDIPCNQFLGQAPGDDQEIQNFCSLKYHTTFPRMTKSDVNGEHELPLYTYLKSQQGFKGFGKGVKAMGMSVLLRQRDWNYKENPDIKWNFTKFVVDRRGNVVARFEPTASMEDVAKCVEACLNEKVVD